MTEAAPQYPRTLHAGMPSRPICAELSVVIPTLGRSILETALFYLADGNMWPGAIIVVDQGRNTDTAHMLQRLGEIGIESLYIPSSQRGRSAGINRGLEQVKTKFVAITDDDCFVASDWVRSMWCRLAGEPDAIITGRVKMAGDPDAEFSTVTSTTERRYTKPELKAHPFIGGNVGMSMSNVQKIGMFDEHPCLASAEDSDYGYRALRLGVPIVYDPLVALYHYHWRDAGERRDRYVDYARSQGGFYGTHLRSGDPLIIAQTARALIRSPIRWARGLVRGDRELAENGRAHTLHLLPGLIAGLRRRDGA